MDFPLDKILGITDKPFVYVDFNELMDDKTVMLSQTDNKNDYLGNRIALREGMAIVGYMDDRQS